MIKRLTISEEDKKHIATAALNPSDLGDDFFDYARVVIKKPWGQEYLVFRNDYTAVWILHIKKGFRTSMHCHPNKKTSLVVLSGSVQCPTLASEDVLSRGQGYLIDKGVFHATEALSDNVVVLETETPTNKKDLIRLQDDYGRKGQGYEGSEFHARLDNSMPHFHKHHERYHFGKRFGDAHVTVVRYQNDYFLKGALPFLDAEVACALKGNFYDSSKRCILEVGDTFMWRNFKERDNFSCDGESEFLLIKTT